MKFEWNELKSFVNKRKHGISFESAVNVFTDGFALSMFDEFHSMDEERWATIGNSPDKGILVVVHTDRIHVDGEYIRLISARRANKDEIYEYLKQFKGE